MKLHRIVIPLVLALTIALVAYFVFPQQLKRSWLVITGKLVDVGGYRLRMECQGNGQPTIIMDAGLAFSMKTWEKVTPRVAKFARVCVYDRAGIGESDPGPTPRTSERIVSEFSRMLSKAKIAPPYILVGHSFGGLNMRLYSSEHPSDVAALILVDGSHEDQTVKYAEILPQKRREEFLLYERGNNPEHVDVTASNDQIRKAPPLREMPFVVLTSEFVEWFPKSSREQMEEAHRQLQSELVQIIPNGKQIFAKGSGHFIQLDRPQLVVAAIKSVLEEVRKHSPKS